jgi:catechol 2,3-dioxygenase-like lactoylglutathione lyase family enzyme
MFKAVAAFSGFSVKDLAKAKEFYVDVLGLTVNEDEMGLKLVLPEGAEVFVYPKDNHESATYTVLNLIVENIDESIDELVAKGVVFEHYDFPDFKTDEKGVARGLAAGKGPDIAWFKDPSGNIFSVLQDKK